MKQQVAAFGGAWREVAVLAALVATCFSPGAMGAERIVLAEDMMSSL